MHKNGSQIAAAEMLSIPFSEGNLSAAIFLPASGTRKKHPCLILCHGAFEYKENFFEMARGAAENGIAAIVPDMPGHGSSSGTRYHVNIGLWVDAISAVIDHVSIRPEIDAGRIGAFGFSSGGTAVLEAALIEQRIKTLITLDATVRNFMGLADTIFFKFLIFIGKCKKKITGTDLRLNLTSVLKKAHVAFDPEVNQAILNDPKLIAAYAAFPVPGAAACAFVDTIERVHRITIHTLAMHGEQDRIDSIKNARRLYDALSGPKSLEIIENSGHSGHLDRNRKKVIRLTIDWALAHL